MKMNIQSKFLLILLVPMVLAIPASSADSNLLSISNTTITQGSSIDVPIMLINSTGVAGVQVGLRYNTSVVNATKLVKGDFTTIFNVDRSFYPDGVYISTMEIGVDKTGNLTVATVTLEAIGSPGDTSPLNLEVIKVTDKQGKSVTPAASARNGTFTISEFIGPPATVAVTATPNTLVANGISTSTITATVRDANGTAVPNEKVTFSVITGTGTVTSPATTDANGVATATYTSSTTPGIETVKAVSENNTAAFGVVNITLTQWTVTNLNVTPSKTIVSAGETFKLNVTALDGSGNVVTVYNGTVNFSVVAGTPANITLPANYTFNPTVDQGTHSFEVKNTKSETMEIKVTDYVNGISGTSGVITVTPASESKLLITPDPASLQAGGTATLTVQMTDQYGNSITTGGNVSQPIGFEVTGSANVVSPPSNLNGAGGATVTVTDSVTETFTLTSRVTLTNGAIITGTATVHSTAAIGGVVVTSDACALYANCIIPANNSAQVTLSVQLVDAQGKTVKRSGLPATNFSATSSNPILPSANIASFSVISPSGTDAEGIIKTKVTAGRETGTTDITVNYKYGTGPTDFYTNKTTLTFGQTVNPDNSEVTASKTIVLANETVIITAQVKDWSATPKGIKDIPVTFKIEGGNGTITDGTTTVSGLNSTLTTLTDQNGEAKITFRNPVISATDGINVINAMVDQTSIGKPQITVMPNVPAKIDVSPSTVGLKNVLGTEQVFTVSLKDAYGNLNATSGVKINVTTDNQALGNMTYDTTTVNNNATLTTNATGQTTLTYRVNSTYPGSATLTFKAGVQAGIPTEINGTARITTSGPTNITITADKKVASTIETVTLTVNLTDAKGNLLGIPDVNVTLRIEPVGKGAVLNKISLVTDQNGQATTTLTSTNSGIFTVYASAGGLPEASVEMTFSGNATYITITPEKPSLRVNETTNLTIQAYDKDGFRAAIYQGESIEGEPITIPRVGNLVFGKTSLAFDSSGTATTNVTSSVAGTYTITANALGTSNKTTITFTPKVKANVSLTKPPDKTTSLNVSATYTITVTNTGEANDTFILNATQPPNASVNLTPTSITLNATESGDVTLSVTSGIAGNYSVDVIATSTSDPNVSETVTVVTTVIAGVRGDLNGDGKVTSVDALMALQMAVGILPVDLAADMNGDGKVTSVDALMILQAAVGIITL